ncbi:MAG: hypothetical protein HRT47_13350 [Candidatus Caenarcaniphilales bacterium]|nr:hypothetical protein [Candidatus Caenarcaniphilales bacterium]
MFDDVNWNHFYSVLFSGAILISVGLKVMFDAKREVEELDRQDSLEN